MKKIFLAALFLSITALLAASRSYADEKALTQEDIARIIGEKLDYKTDYMDKLRAIGITPLGEWDPKKNLTKDDLDAILIRMARRDPVVEKQEPAKLLDSIGFPARGVTQKDVEKIVNSKAFMIATANSKLLLAPGGVPLPTKYNALINQALLSNDVALTTTPSMAAALAAAEAEVGQELTEETTQIVNPTDPVYPPQPEPPSPTPPPHS